MNYQNDFWSNYFKYYDLLLDVIPYQELFDTITKKLSLNDDLDILDLGAGTGNLQCFISQKAKITSLDCSKEALSRLQSKFPNSKIIQHSLLEKLPFPDNAFDRIVSNNVLYTLDKSKWDNVAAEIYRVCKPNGIIVVSNLNKNFKALDIYKDHVKKSIGKYGWLKTFTDLIRLVYPTFKMLRYNKVISRNDSSGAYSFLQEEEQRDLFVERGFDCVGVTELVYSEQAFLNKFVKSIV